MRLPNDRQRGIDAQQDGPRPVQLPGAVSIRLLHGPDCPVVESVRDHRTHRRRLWLTFELERMRSMPMTAASAAPPEARTETPDVNDLDRSIESAEPACGPRALCGWSPRPLPADTMLKGRVDRILVGNAPAIVMVVTVVALMNIAPHLPVRPGLVVDGLAALVGGSWCSLNFWRCRHAHCLVTGVGWLLLGLFVFVEAGIGHSDIGGNESPVLLAILGLGLLFETAWYAARRTHAVGAGAGSRP